MLWSSWILSLWLKTTQKYPSWRWLTSPLSLFVMLWKLSQTCCTMETFLKTNLNALHRSNLTITQKLYTSACFFLSNFSWIQYQKLICLHANIVTEWNVNLVFGTQSKLYFSFLSNPLFKDNLTVSNESGHVFLINKIITCRVVLLCSNRFMEFMSQSSW